VRRSVRRERHGARTGPRSGFTMLEMLIVVVILGITALLAVPSFLDMQSDGRARTAVRTVSNALQLARGQAIQKERNHVVFFGMGAGTDACGNTLGAPIVILDDESGATGNANNCCIDGDEDRLGLPADADEFRGLNWSTTHAGAPPAQDAGRGSFSTGSTLADAGGNDAAWVLFRPDGVPVGVSTACATGQIGSGGGGVYLTNGGDDYGTERDYGVVLTPLGTTKIFAWDRSQNQWTD